MISTLDRIAVEFSKISMVVAAMVTAVTAYSFDARAEYLGEGVEPPPPQFMAMIDRHAATYDPHCAELDFRRLVVALISVESGGPIGYDPAARSRAGAVGLAQVMPGTARDPGLGVAGLHDRTDPDQSIRFAAEYLAALLREFGCGMDRALRAYNMGIGAERRRRRPNAETRAHIRWVADRYEAR